MSGESSDFGARGGLPEFNGKVTGADEYMGAVWREGHRERGLFASEGVQFDTGGDIPETRIAAEPGKDLVTVR